jgi:hypothetical protein
LVKNTTGTDIIVKPFLIQNNVSTDLRNYADVCGANNFHYNNGTIEFVLNGKNNCQVRVRLSSYVKLTARLSIPVMEFFNNNGATTFVTNICAFLNIDPGRLKIVGVKDGSIIVESLITAPGLSLDTSTQATSDNHTQYTELTELASSISQALSQGTVSVGAPVIGVSTEIFVVNRDGTLYTVTPSSSSESNTRLTLIILLSTAIPIFVIFIVVIGYYFIRRRREKVSNINCESEVVLSDDMHKSKIEMIKVSEIPF